MARPELMRSLWYNDFEKLKQLYDADKTLFSSIDGGRRTAMHFAVFSDCVETVRAVHTLDSSLLDKRSDAGETPMHLAAKYGNIEIVDALHQLGSRAHALKDNQRRRPYDVAATPELRQHILDLYFERSISRDLLATLDEE